MAQKDLEKRAKNDRKMKLGKDGFPDLTDPEVFRSFCNKYYAAIAPAIRAIYLLQARSYENAFKKTVCSCY